MKKPTLRSALLAAVVLAGASLGSTAAQAQVIGNSPQALDLVDDSAFFGDSLEAGNSGATFADRFTFTVDEALGVNVDAIVGSVSRSANVGLDITGLWIYDGNDTLVSTGTSLQSGAVDVWTCGRWPATAWPSATTTCGSTATWSRAKAPPLAARSCWRRCRSPKPTA